MSARRSQLMFPAARRWPKQPDVARCAGCRHPTDAVPLGPMLNDDVWHQLAEPGERLLCAPCTLDRAIKRGVRITLASLRPCPFNLFHSPHSWFDLFRSGEDEEPANMAEWHQAMALLHPHSDKELDELYARDVAEGRITPPAVNRPHTATEATNE